MCHFQFKSKGLTLMLVSFLPPYSYCLSLPKQRRVSLALSRASSGTRRRRSWEQPTTCQHRPPVPVEQGGGAGLPAGVCLAPRQLLCSSQAGFSWTKLNRPSVFLTGYFAFQSYSHSAVCRNSPASFLACNLFNPMRNLTGI